MPRDYCVYVVDLNPRVWRERKKMRDANPHYDPEAEKGCLYVGMTSSTPEKRFATHKSGGFTSRPVVRTYGRYLRPRLYKNIPRMPKTKAEADERDRAKALRKRGYAVWPVAAGGAFTIRT